MAIDLPEDMAFHRADWLAERIGWGVMLLIVLAGILGFTGRGPFGTATVGDGALQVKYDRVMRNDAPGTVRIRIGPPATNDTVVQLWASRETLANCAPDLIAPSPEHTRSASDRTTFDFPIQPGSDSVIVILRCMPRTTGRHQGMIGIEGGPAVRLSSLVLP